MKSKLFLILLPFFALTSCKSQDVPSPIIEEDPNTDVDEPVYAEWPEEDISSYVKSVTGYEVTIPSFDKAKSIEINIDNMVLEGFFAIYCYTDSAQSENEYAQKLIENEWEVETEKVENYFNAYDKEYKVWMNFAYDPEFGDLEIYITQCTKTKWPAKVISDAVEDIQPGSNTVIPKFEAYTVVANYYPEISALAINGYGFEDTIIDDYKDLLKTLGWDVFFNEESQEWNAISPAKDIEIHFYVDDSKGEFNVDVFAYVEPVNVWPADEIAGVVQDIGATGTVIPFKGENTGFEVNTDYFPPAIYIFCDKSKQQTNADAYNQGLLDAGYELIGALFGDPLYCYPETTLAYRAVVLLGVLQIELFNITTLDL